MSYEGYSQFWCKNGHYWEVDCNLAEYEQDCPICGSFRQIENMVDTTNDEGNPLPLNIKSVKTCEECNSILETIYKIPKKRKK